MNFDVAVVEEAAWAGHAAQKMEVSHTGVVVVWDGLGRALGVVTERDLAIKVCGGRLPPESTPVTEIMTRGLPSCRPQDPVSQVASLMIQHRTLTVLVTGPLHRLHGVIELGDLVHADEERALAVLKELSPRRAQPWRRLAAI